MERMEFQEEYALETNILERKMLQEEYGLLANLELL